MQLKKKISELYQHTFDVSKSGLVAIFVSARCKSKFQLKKFILICGILIVSIVFFFIFLLNKKEKFEIVDFPTFIINNNEIWRLDFNWDGKAKSIQITNDGFEKNLLETSPDQKKISYYRHLYGKPLYKDEESHFKNYISLMIYDLENKTEREIVRGNFFTRDYEWINGNTIRLYMTAGIGVRAYRDININISEPFIVAEHRSPKFWTTELWDDKSQGWISNDDYLSL